MLHRRTVRGREHKQGRGS